MSTNRPRRIDRDTAEQLLGGAMGDPSAGQGASLTGPDGGPGQLARVLAAAAAPATAGELAGEEAALAAFREARLASRPVMTAPVRRRSMATATLARAFSTKAAAAVLGATVLCGVAVAAGTGNLPVLGGDSPEPAHTLGTDGASGSASSPAGGTASSPAGGTGSSGRPSGASPAAGPQAAVPSAGTHPGSPSADGHGGGRPAAGPLADLCRGFVERTAKGEHPLQLAADPLFAQLVTEAGGADKVAEYCAKAPDKAGQGDRQGATDQPRDPGRTGSGSGSGQDSGAGKGGSGQGAQNGGSGTTVGGTTVGGNANGGSDTKPGGHGGATAPALSGGPTLRPGKSDDPQDRSAPR
ncbi:hypothetical protein ACPC54_12135 [Kitasatospora sp. NPDC094028]